MILHAADIDDAAAGFARRNLADTGAEVYVGDLDAPLPPGLAGAVDMVVACAPYVPTGEIAFMPREARKFEPSISLDGGPDGTTVQAGVAAAAARLLKPAGALILETSEALAGRTVAACERAGLAASIVEREDIDAVAVVARRASP